MVDRDHRAVYVTISIYAILALVWLAFARWVVPPLILAENPGRAVAAIKHLMNGVPAPFLARGTINRWWEFATAVLIVMVMHLTILLLIRRYDHKTAGAGNTTDIGASRWQNAFLLFIALAFLAVTVLTGACHDYYLYLQMWYEVRQWHDPWFIVFGINGETPLNAYGPLFNLLAGLAWVNPLAPKLLFAYAYLVFAISEIKAFTVNGPSSSVARVVLTLLFWNPFPWVEIAIRGHFDILVGLSCLYAIKALIRGHEVRSGIGLALGVLLKYLPVVLLPFLAFDRGRLRSRFVVTAVASIALGMAISVYLWGPSTFAPLEFAATRSATTMSIFRFLHGRYSPLYQSRFAVNIAFLARVILILALVRAWSWNRTRQPDLATAGAVAVVTTVLFYPTGFPQYQMVPFVLGTYWTVRRWHSIRGRLAPIAGVVLYFGWLAAFDLYYAFVVEESNAYYWDIGRDIVGLPSFVAGCAFLAALISSATRQDDGPGDSAEFAL
jgi:hypothetical protein